MAIAAATTELLEVKDTKGTWAICLGLLLIPMALNTRAGYVCTTINYVATAAAFLWAILPMVRRGQKCPLWRDGLAWVLMILACNMEFYVPPFLIIVVALLLRAARQRRLDWQGLVLLGLGLVSGVFAAKSPMSTVAGYASRAVDVFPGFETLGLDEKLILAFTSTAGGLISRYQYGDHFFLGTLTACALLALYGCAREAKPARRGFWFLPLTIAAVAGIAGRLAPEGSALQRLFFVLCAGAAYAVARQTRFCKSAWLLLGAGAGCMTFINLIFILWRYYKIKQQHKKLGSWLLALAMLVGLLPAGAIPAKAVGHPPDAWEEVDEVKNQKFTEKSTSLSSYTATFLIGNKPVTEAVTIDTGETLGTKTNPFSISSEAELILFGQLTSAASNGKYFILDKPGGVYDMEGDTKYMLPLFASIGETAYGMPVLDANIFQGTLLGNGATIQRATVGDYSAMKAAYLPGLLSGAVGAYFCDVTVSDIRLYQNEEIEIAVNAGGLLTFAGETCIVNCHSRNINFDGVSGRVLCAGGLAGYGAKLYSCSNMGDVKVKFADKGETYLGGLVGLGSAFNSHSIGDVSATRKESGQLAYVGGIAGNGIAITNCYSVGDVSFTGTSGYPRLGGIAGGGTANNCYYRASETYTAVSAVFSSTVSSCGTFTANDGTLAALDGTDEGEDPDALLGDGTLLSALNAFVDASGNDGYRRWAKPLSAINVGYPDFYVPLTVTGGTLGTDYTYQDGTLTVKTVTPLTISGSTTTDCIVVDAAGEKSADITLDRVNITLDAELNKSALEVRGAGLNLTLLNTNTLTGGTGSGISVESQLALTAESTDSLTAA